MRQVVILSTVIVLTTCLLTVRFSYAATDPPAPSVPIGAAPGASTAATPAIPAPTASTPVLLDVGESPASESTDDSARTTMTTLHLDNHGPAAQDHSLPGYYRWGVKLGFFVTNGGINSAQREVYPNANSTMLSLGITYRLQAAGKSTLLQPELYLDASSDIGTDALDVSSQDEGHRFAGLGIADRISLNLGHRNAVYFGGGVGIYETGSFHSSIEVDQDTSLGDQSTYQQSDYNCARVGCKLFAGVQLSRGYMLEASFQNLGNADNFAYQGVAVLLGYRR